MERARSSIGKYIHPLHVKAWVPHGEYGYPLVTRPASAARFRTLSRRRPFVSLIVNALMLIGFAEALDDLGDSGQELVGAQQGKVDVGFGNAF